MKVMGARPQTPRERLLAALVLLPLVAGALPGGLAAQERDPEDREAAEAAELARRDSLRRIFDPAAAFEPLDLPEPGPFRDATGAPGPEYWQQRADYHIRASLVGDRIEGTERITYTNHSPDSITSLWLQLDQNLFRENSYGAMRAEELGGDVRHGGFFRDGGFVISGVRVEHEGEMTVPEYRTEDTMMEILLDEPLPSGGAQLEVDIDFAFEIPESGGDRMGQLDIRGGIIYQLAQWYPRMFTYDDVNGWNQSPFLGQGEWYLEFGDFEVELTVPRDFVVVATGELLNPEDVLTPTQRERLARARNSEETIHIIEPDEAGDDETRPPGELPLTWRFRRTTCATSRGRRRTASCGMRRGGRTCSSCPPTPRRASAGAASAGGSARRSISATASSITRKSGSAIRIRWRSTWPGSRWGWNTP